MTALVVAALGVVFGDIGTSPLYALQTVFASTTRGQADRRATSTACISLIFWSITLIVSVKYVTLIMRADNDGEGGIMALIALVAAARPGRRGADASLILLGMFGASLFYGDGVITPAISVLSAVEGMEVATPGARADWCVPIAIAILVGCSRSSAAARTVGAALRAGHGRLVRRLGVSGLAADRAHPAILEGAVADATRSRSSRDHPCIAFVALGAVVLAITGAEALYADMGHFGRPPIRRAWFFAGVPGADPQLPRPGRADPARPEAVAQSVLPPGAGLGTDPDGRPGDRWPR